MIRALRFSDSKVKRRLAGVYAMLLLLNGGAWLAVVLAAHRYPLLLALGVTAYVLGLRHAVDPDHIAAIDNTTRKLMHAGQRPVGVGFFFSLGHSTIVFALSALVAVFGIVLKQKLPALQAAGGLVGTSISALFLIVIGIANAVVLVETIRAYRRLRRGETTAVETLSDDAALGGGFLSRILRPALGFVKRSWHMYPVGLLFGLGFDTATEVALLGIAAASGAGGMPVVYILLLPLLFVAGMSLVDTTDGVAMLGAYGWAYIEPSRKLLYNVNVTLLSVIVALFIGIAEAVAVLGTRLGSPELAAFTNWLSLSTLGYGIIGVFVANIAVSAFLCRTWR